MDKKPFKKILIANRGEIAIRIARAAFELGVSTVGVYSHEDRFSLHRYKTDESYKIGFQGNPLGAYLDYSALVALAVKVGADAVHPGYGFLSESAEFAEACRKNGVAFIGPAVGILKDFGDKVTARKTAANAGINVIPGTPDPVQDLTEAKMWADKIGYPVTLKAVSGGGGKGIRTVSQAGELEQAFNLAKSEAQTSFGKSEIYLEKHIVRPRHIEVQILGDQQGQIVHLYERDCSIQRRNQKVVEVAPASGISGKLRASLHSQALKLAESVGYQGLGTVEFLVSEQGEPWFLEVNPRVQVEHTVTEMVTGIDLMQASILVAAGITLDDPRIGIESQKHITVNGTAIQCRITTEDPLNQFAPDTGQVIAYRPAAGFGIRLDEGLGTTGAEVTPHYDSLLVKVTSWSPTLKGAAAKMFRSLSEFRIRGLKHNTPLLKNVVRHPEFLDGRCNTRFLEEFPGVFRYKIPRDRATRLLKYIAEVTVNDPHGLANSKRHGSIDGQKIIMLEGEHTSIKPEKSAKQIFDQEGADALVRWIKKQRSLLLTDTTMRDAHQSLFATRLRTRDMLNAAPFYDNHGKGFFSLEVWGGATFDTSMRFLKEDPWERLARVRELIPGTLLQMLLRGDNAVGYSNYPAWVVREFIGESVAAGLDLFRVFDCLNQPDKMKVAVEAIKKHGALAELCICYTGDLTDPEKTKYNLEYYLDRARELISMGADIICIKDMAGLLKPKAAAKLISALKETVDAPVHLHTHDTSGVGISMLLEAARSGCDIVDGAISSMSGLTSQPSINALIAALSGEKNAPQVTLPAVDELARYWEGVRSEYHAFDPGIRATSTDVYFHEIPGGQYSNFYEQARKVGLSAHEFFELTNRYREVNEMMGDLIKVTPSSKVVGDLALLLHKQSLSCKQVIDEKIRLDYPDSVVSFFKGHMGIPHGGFNEEFRELVLGANPPEPCAPQPDKDDDIEMVQLQLSEKLARKVSRQECLSYRMYPKVFMDFIAHSKKYGKVTTQLSTPVFFYGMKQGEEVEVDLEPGKTLYISLKGISSIDHNGMKKVFFKLNGFDREVEVEDHSAEKDLQKRMKADPGNEQHIPSPMPGKVIGIKVKVGNMVSKGDTILITESMKMEYAVTARCAGEIAEILVQEGDMVESGDLLIRVI